MLCSLYPWPSRAVVRNATTLESFFDDLPVYIQRFEPHPGRVSSAFTVPGSDPEAEPLTLLGHTDVTYPIRLGDRHKN